MTTSGHRWRRRAERAPLADASVAVVTAASQDVRLAQAIAENMLEAVAVIRPADGLLVYTNPSWDRMFGYERGELVGEHVSVVNAPADRTPQERAEEIMAALDRHGSWRGEVHNVRKDGSDLWSDACLSQFDHPEHGPAWLAVQHEVTQRKEAERVLRGAMERYRAMFDESPAATAILTEDLRLSEVNAAFCELTGYGSDELTGRPLSDVVAPEDGGADAELVASALRGDEPAGIETRRYISRAGETLHVIVCVRRLGIPGGAPQAVLTVTRFRSAGS